jgi:hypothetical protein
VFSAANSKPPAAFAFFTLTLALWFPMVKTNVEMEMTMQDLLQRHITDSTILSSCQPCWNFNPFSLHFCLAAQSFFALSVPSLLPGHLLILANVSLLLQMLLFLFWTIAGMMPEQVRVLGRMK